MLDHNLVDTHAWMPKLVTPRNTVFKTLQHERSMRHDPYIPMEAANYSWNLATSPYKTRTIDGAKEQ